MDQFIKESKAAQNMIDLLNENPAGLDSKDIAEDLDLTHQYVANLAYRFFSAGYFDLIFTDKQGIHTYTLTPKFKARYHQERASLFSRGRATAAEEEMRMNMVSRARQYGVFGVLVAQAIGAQA